MDTQKIRLLILEDSAADAALQRQTLSDAGLAFTARTVTRRADFVQALVDFAPHVVITDFRLPDFDGPSAVDFVRTHHPHIPVVVVSGTIGDEQAAELIKAGASDYVLKDRLSRLSSAVRRALSDRVVRLELRRFREAMEQLVDGIFMIEPKTGRFLDINAAAAANLGYARAELLDLTAMDLDPALRDPSDWQSMVQRIRGTERLTLERTHRRKDGSTLAVEVSVRYVSAVPVDYLIAVVRDITERRQAEEAVKSSAARLRAIFDFEPECIKILSTDGRLLEINPAGLALIEAVSLADLQGRPLLQMVHSDDRAAFLKTHATAVAGGRSTLEFRLTGLKGTERHLEMHAVGLPDPDGTIRSILNVTRDITQRKRAELELNRRHAELERFHRLSCGREMRMIELKQEVNALVAARGMAPPYDVSFTGGGTSASPMDGGR